LNEYKYDESYSHWGIGLNKLLESQYKARGFSGTCGLNERGVLAENLAERIRRCPQNYNYSILDVGCFLGQYFGEISKLVSPSRFRYTGIDINTSAIEQCQRDFANVDNANFQVGDAFNIEFEDGQFDSVICTEVLIHLPELTRPLNELYRASKEYMDLILHVTRTHPGNNGYPTPDRKGEFLDIYYTLGELYSEFEKLSPLPNMIQFQRFPKFSGSGKLYTKCEYGLFNLSKGWRC
jgi:SAM-dependent methyltransferase